MKKLAATIFLYLLTYGDAYAYRASIFGCTVNVPEKYIVDTDFEGNNAVKFRDSSEFSLSSFSVNDAENIDTSLLEFKEMEEQGLLRLNKMYATNGFAVIEYFLSGGRRLDVLISKKQMGTFFFESKSLWPSMIESCDGGLSDAEIESIMSGNVKEATCEAKNYMSELLSLLSDLSTMSIVRDSGELKGYRLYEIDRQLSDRGIANGDIITGICGADFSDSSACLDNCDGDSWTVTLKRGDKALELEVPHNFSMNHFSKH